MLLAAAAFSRRGSRSGGGGGGGDHCHNCSRGNKILPASTMMHALGNVCMEELGDASREWEKSKLFVSPRSQAPMNHASCQLYAEQLRSVWRPEQESWQFHKYPCMLIGTGKRAAALVNQVQVNLFNAGQVPAEEVAKVTTENAKRFFSL